MCDIRQILELGDFFAQFWPMNISSLDPPK